jgi:hypothetical protein
MPMRDTLRGICEQSKYSWIKKLCAAGEQPTNLGNDYDLRHGYCTYDFFEQCPDRMACAK